MGFDCAKDLPTDAGAAEVTAIASAKISVILKSIVMLRLSRPVSAPQTRSHHPALISALAFEGGPLNVDGPRSRSAILRLFSSTRAIHRHHRVVIMEADAISRARDLKDQVS